MYNYKSNILKWRLDVQFTKYFSCDCILKSKNYVIIFFTFCVKKCKHFFTQLGVTHVSDVTEEESLRLNTVLLQIWSENDLIQAELVSWISRMMRCQETLFNLATVDNEIKNFKNPKN